jgi:hypothetical protein
MAKQSNTKVSSGDEVAVAINNQFKKCWNYDSLHTVITAECSPPILESIEFTSQRTISEMTANQVQHPVCGLVPRVGWAALKNGIEMSFSVIRKIVLLNEVPLYFSPQCFSASLSSPGENSKVFSVLKT